MSEAFLLAVTGGRDYSDVATVHRILDSVRTRHPNMRLIHGDASGADRLAKEWARLRGVTDEPYPADWATHGRRAGPMRNALMAGIASGCVAFPGGKGTADMTRRCRALGVPVWEIAP